jgi:hypothetical protein
MNKHKLLAWGALAGALTAGTAARADDGVQGIGAAGCQIVNPNPQPDESATWTGGCRDGFADGDGELDWIVEGKHASHYVGHVRAGRPDGRGVYDNLRNKLHYEGDYKAGMFDGVGALAQADGTRLVGHFEKGFLEGEGEGFTHDGGHYRGQWHASHFEGQGEAIDLLGSRYVGPFHDGRPDGAGTLEINGTTIKGIWKAGLQSGPVVTDGPGRNHYEGDSQLLTPVGQGVRTYADGNVYRGTFVAGRREGQGTLTSEDGRLLYDGGWKNDVFEGQGRVLCGDGGWFEGTLHQGRRDGPGKTTGPMGTMEGNFVGDLEDFRGVMVDKAGRRSEGHWIFGKPDGEQVLTGDGKVVHQTFRQGLLDGPWDGRADGGDHMAANFVAGKLEGPVRIEFSDGRKLVGQYQGGLAEGAWVWTDRDGSLSRVEFRHGVPLNALSPLPKLDHLFPSGPGLSS